MTQLPNSERRDQVLNRSGQRGVWSLAARDQLKCRIGPGEKLDRAVDVLRRIPRRKGTLLVERHDVAGGAALDHFGAVVAQHVGAADGLSLLWF